MAVPTWIRRMMLGEVGEVDVDRVYGWLFERLCEEGLSEEDEADVRAVGEWLWLMVGGLYPDRQGVFRSLGFEVGAGGGGLARAVVDVGFGELSRRVVLGSRWGEVLGGFGGRVPEEARLRWCVLAHVFGDGDGVARRGGVEARLWRWGLRHGRRLLSRRDRQLSDAEASWLRRYGDGAESGGTAK